MKSTSLRRALVPGVAVAALVLSGCGASNEGDSGDRRRSGDSSASSGTLAGGGVLRAGGRAGRLDRRLPDGQPRRHRHLRPGRLRRRPRELRLRRLPVRRHRRLPHRRRGRADRRRPSAAAATPSRSPTTSARSRSSSTSTASTTCNLTPDTLAGDLRRHDHDVGRRGDRRGQPRRRPAERADQRRCTAPTSPARPRTSPTTSTPSPRTSWDRRRRSRRGRTSTAARAPRAPPAWSPRSPTARTRSATPTPARPATSAPPTIEVGDEFVGPSPEAAAKILEVSPRSRAAPTTTMVFDLDHTTEEAGTYPIVLTSYLIACPTYDDQATADLVKAYLELRRQRRGPGAGRRPRPARPRSARPAPEGARRSSDTISAG